LRLEDDERACFLTGDADYNVVPSNQKIGLDAVVVPHHGGKGSSSVPAAEHGGRAVVSYGIPNKYKHANESRLPDHDDANWRIFRTAAHERQWRGSRWLYPSQITEDLSLWTGSRLLW
jgi:beta-lactamase superfamily II metal-dependent hydrolase